MKAHGNTVTRNALRCCVYNVHSVRVDKYLAALPLQISRSQIQQLCKTVLVNNKTARLSQLIAHKDELMVYFANKEQSSAIQSFRWQNSGPELNLATVHEDDCVLLISKPRGMLVHPGNGQNSISIAEMLAGKLLDYRKEDMLHHRAGIVHRLDKNTSGILVVAKTAAAHEILSKEFAERLVEKHYIAVLKGCPPKEQGRMQLRMERHRIHRKRFTVTEEGGRDTITEYRVLFTNSKYSVVLFTPQTGRTHQLRVLAQHLGCPILGDELYSRKSRDYPDTKLMLHAFFLSFYHPAEIAQYMSTVPPQKALKDIVEKGKFSRQDFICELPADMQTLFAELGCNLSKEKLQKIIYAKSNSNVLGKS